MPSLNAQQISAIAAIADKYKNEHTLFVNTTHQMPGYLPEREVSISFHDVQEVAQEDLDALVQQHGLEVWDTNVFGIMWFVPEAEIIG